MKKWTRRVDSLNKKNFSFAKRKKKRKAFRNFIIFHLLLFAIIAHFYLLSKQNFPIEIPLQSKANIWLKTLLGDEGYFAQEEHFSEGIISIPISEIDNFTKKNRNLKPSNVPVDDNEAGKKSIRYKVRSGDTVWSIAKKFKVSRSDLIRINLIENPKRLRIGAEILIPSY